MAMPSPQHNSIRLTPDIKSKTASKVRAQFNTLIKKLETERKRLSEWHNAIPLMRTRASVELMPLGKQYDQRRRELICCCKEPCKVSTG